MNYITAKAFCRSEKNERQAAEWEKTFLLRVSIKGLKSRVYKELLKIFLFKKGRLPMRKMDKRFERFLQKKRSINL